jgi:hypothetical protein
MRKAFNLILLWLVLFLAFQAFACKSVQKDVKEEPGEAAAAMSQTNTMETAKTKAGSTGTVKAKAKAGNTGTVKAKTKAGGTGTVKAKAVSTETGKSKQGALVELEEEVITEAEKIINPTVRKAILPSGVGLLILASLMSSKKDKRKDD